MPESPPEWGVDLVDGDFWRKTPSGIRQPWTGLDNGGHGQFEAVLALQVRGQFVHRRLNQPEKQGAEMKIETVFDGISSKGNLVCMPSAGRIYPLRCLTDATGEACPPKDARL